MSPEEEEHYNSMSFEELHSSPRTDFIRQEEKISAVIALIGFVLVILALVVPLFI